MTNQTKTPPAGQQPPANPPLTEEERRTLARVSLQPKITTAMTVGVYKGGLKNIDGPTLIDIVQAKIDQSKGGDLSGLEAMLVGQAIALDAIFSDLASRAAGQEHLQNRETFLGLAMRAQSHCRASIQAIVELKHPRQTMFVKQANVSNGAQQVNNTNPSSRTGEKNVLSGNKVSRNLSGAKRELLPDTSASSPAITVRPRVAALDKVHRAKVSRG